MITTTRRALQTVLMLAMLAFVTSPANATWWFVTNPTNCSGNWDLDGENLGGCEVWYGG